MEITGYHPFKSVEGKEKYLGLYDSFAKLWPIPSEARMVDTSYGKTFVRISGPKDAPPLILLHGMGSNSLMWLAHIEALSKDYRTYAIDDIYGNGRSIYTKTVKDSNDFVNWLDQLFNAIELENNINLAGMSYGGWQTSQYVLRFPEKLNKIVLIAPAATVQPISLGFTIRAVLSIIPIDYFFKSFMRWIFEDYIKKDRKTAERLIDNMILASKYFKSKHMVAPTVLDDNELKSIKVPTLFMIGENEKIYSAQKALQRINSIAPQIKTELIPGAGHDLTAVQIEMCDKKILEFLSEE